MGVLLLEDIEARKRSKASGDDGDPDGSFHAPERRSRRSGLIRRLRGQG